MACYTGSHTGERGRDTEGEAVWTLAQLGDLLQEWIICGWQEREHDGLRHPMMPRCALSPNEMWAALVAVCGYVPVPLGREDYIELRPVKRQKINDYGTRIDYRTYDHQILNPYRGEASPTADGLWEIHYNPHAPSQVWVRLPDPGQLQGHGWETVPWIHHTLVSAPFTDFTWQHIRRTVARRADRARHEHDLALALRELLERAAAGHGSRRDKVVAARARAHTAANADGAVWGSCTASSRRRKPTGPDPGPTRPDGRIGSAEPRWSQCSSRTPRAGRPRTSRTRTGSTRRSRWNSAARYRIPPPAAVRATGVPVLDSDPASSSASHGEAPPYPRERLNTLRRELFARVELVGDSYQRAVDSAHTLMTDFEEARRLRAQLGEEALPAEQRIEWMQKLTKAREAAQASVTTLGQVEALIPQI